MKPMVKPRRTSFKQNFYWNKLWGDLFQGAPYEGQRAAFCIRLPLQVFVNGPLLVVCDLLNSSHSRLQIGCMVVTALLHYLWLVVFMWVLEEGIYLYQNLTPRINWRIKLHVYVSVAWGKKHVYFSSSSWYCLTLV